MKNFDPLEQRSVQDSPKQLDCFAQSLNLNKKTSQARTKLKEDVKMVKLGSTKSATGVCRRSAYGPEQDEGLGAQEETMQLTQPQPEPFINADEAARFLSMSRLRVIRLARMGRLPAYSFPRGRGNDWFFLKTELAASMRGELKLVPRPFVIAERKDQ